MKRKAIIELDKINGTRSTKFDEDDKNLDMKNLLFEFLEQRGVDKNIKLIGYEKNEDFGYSNFILVDKFKNRYELYLFNENDSLSLSEMRDELFKKSGLEEKINDFIYNKALQKIIESYRVSKEEKEKIRTMKRKAN